jgi:glycosyltransferase involved in cell wall biosynthesis
MNTQGHTTVSAVTAAEEPLRIAFYTPALPESGAANGVVTYTRIMRDALRELGHEVFLVTTERMEYPDGHVAPLTRINPLFAGLRLRLGSTLGEHRGEAWVRMNVRNAFQAARRAGVQVFELEESFGWAGQLVGNGVAIVERLHGPHVFVRDEIETAECKRSGDRRQKAEFASFAKVQAVSSPTQRLVDELVPFGLDPSIARIIPNPMPTAAPSASWCIENADADQILFVGRFDLCKGADVAIRAFAEAAEQKPALKLIIVGPDNGLRQVDGSVAKFADFVAREVPPEVRSRISFLGPQSAANIQELRGRSALSLATSRFETFGYMIAEAMAVGMPVLTSSTFGGEALVRNGVDGFVVPVGDIGATAEAMLQMTSNPAKLAEMGKSAYRRVSEWLSPRRIARETVAVYREAIARA